MAGEFQVSGRNAEALFPLKIHRGDGMSLLAMNWKEEEGTQETHVAQAAAERRYAALVGGTLYERAEDSRSRPLRLE